MTPTNLEQYGTQTDAYVARYRRRPEYIDGRDDLRRLSRRNAIRVAWENFQSRRDREAQAQRGAETVVEFVEKKFVPEHVATKSLSGRTHFQAILKHVLTPEEVSRIFEAGAKKANTKLSAIPDWPYLSGIRLRDARPEDVQRLISAALARGYSAQTVTHIRNVVSAIFAHARRSEWFTGDNPASLLKLPEMVRKEAHVLSLAQAQAVLARMRHPEKEMALIALLTGMNMAEICGLQWKCVNLTESWCDTGGEPIPPMSIAVRTQWSRGEMSGVQHRSRSRNLRIPAPLLPTLLGLRARGAFTASDDFVITSATGAAVSESKVAARRLQPIGKELDMPWLRWQVFRRTHAALVLEFGMHEFARLCSQC